MWEIIVPLEELKKQLSSGSLLERSMARIAFCQMAATAKTKDTEEMLTSDNEIWRFLGRLKQKEMLQKFEEAINKDSDTLG